MALALASAVCMAASCLALRSERNLFFHTCISLFFPLAILCYYLIFEIQSNALLFR